MGLDMYVNTAKTIEDDEPINLCYWRKFNALHNWMEQLYRAKGGDEDMFNCVRLPLTVDDLNALEEACSNKELEPVEGFFFGSQDPVTNEEYDDLFKDIGKMKEAIRDGFIVYYDSWW